MRLFLTMMLCLGLSGCATAAKMNNLSLGMNKQEVIRTMGQPNSTKAGNGKEVLEYHLMPNMWSPYCQTELYWVVLEDGKVIKYGRAGDFGTAMPQDRREYDIKIQNR